ncbi:MAG: hypothetical protein WKG01_31055 [Kofleriaceae bacterium]
MSRRDRQHRLGEVLKSTGFPAYDAKIEAGIQSWKYKPYTIASGEAVPVCTSVTVVYVAR